MSSITTDNSKAVCGATTVTKTSSNQLWKDCWLCSLRIGFPTGTRKLDFSDLGLPILDSELIKLGNWQTYPAEHRKEIKNIEQRGRSVQYKYGNCFPSFAGFWLMSPKVLPLFEQEIAEVKKEFFEKQQLLIQNYDSDKDSQKEKVKEVCLKIFNDKLPQVSSTDIVSNIDLVLQHFDTVYPTKEELLLGFYFEWDFMLGTFPENADSAIEVKLLEEQRENFKSKYKEAHINITEQIRSKLIEKFNTIKEKLLNGPKNEYGMPKALNVKTIKALKEEIALAKIINPWSDHVLSDFLETFESDWLNTGYHNSVSALVNSYSSDTSLKNFTNALDFITADVETLIEDSEKSENPSVYNPGRRKFRNT